MLIVLLLIRVYITGREKKELVLLHIWAASASGFSLVAVMVVVVAFSLLVKIFGD